jgi:S1-C subfamily serine protease
VRPGSVAEKVGLAAGDVLTAVDGEATPDKESVLIRLGEKAWGDSLALEVVRSGQRHRLTAVLRREAPAPAVPPA